MPRHVRSFVVCSALYCILVSSTLGLNQRPATANDSDRAFVAHLAAGEFGPARHLAEQASAPRERDRKLRQIAERQFLSGARSASLRTAYRIQDDGLRSRVYDRVSTKRSEAPGSRGGAALADFDSLIDLITSTTAPDSWDTVGGPGAIEPFPTGVYVDPSGTLKRVRAEDPEGGLTAVHKRASRHTESGDVRRSSALRKVSLTRLERYAQLLWAQGKDPDAIMRSMAGIYEVKYVLVYPETRDIVLAGPAGDWILNSEGRPVNVDRGRPVLRLDDFVVLLRNAFEKDGLFGCAITPRKDGLACVQAFLRDSSKPLKPSQRKDWLHELRAQLGAQDISVFGIDPRTHVARTIVEADYHMKLVGIGLEEGTAGVSSYLDNVARLGKEPTSMDVLRWWFVLNHRSVRTSEGREAYELVGPGVKVLSENEMLTERGERVHTGKSSDLNQEFAHSFTRHFAALADQYPVYADLENIFDLALAAAVIRAEDLAGRLAWRRMHFGDSSKYLVGLGTIPKQVESVINHRVVDRRRIVVGVSGGVSVDSRKLVQRTAIRPDDYGLLQAAHASSSPDATPDSSWWWD